MGQGVLWTGFAPPQRQGSISVVATVAFLRLANAGQTSGHDQTRDKVQNQGFHRYIYLSNSDAARSLIAGAIAGEGSRPEKTKLMPNDFCSCATTTRMSPDINPVMLVKHLVRHERLVGGVGMSDPGRGRPRREVQLRWDPGINLAGTDIVVVKQVVLRRMIATIGSGRVFNIDEEKQRRQTRAAEHHAV